MDGAVDLPLQCVLHVRGDTEFDGEAVVPFAKQTWGKAGDVAQARKKYQKRSKYLDICESINFEDEPLPHYGFHSGCYSKFTAYQMKSKLKTSSSDDTIETRSMVSKPSVATSSTTGVLEKKCIFCKCPDRKHFPSGFENLSICEVLEAQDGIILAARQQGDRDFLREYENIDFIAKEVMYHKTCRKRYISKGAKAQEKDNEVTYTKRREFAFTKLLSFIDSNVIHKETSKSLVDINNTYIEFLIEEGFKTPTSEPYNLLSKIKAHYGSKLQVHQESKKQGTYLSLAKDEMNKEIKNVALFLREKILQLKENKVPNPITVEAICDGQCPDIPGELLDFYRIMYTGSKEEGSQRVERYIESSAEDDIFKATRGSVKPSKHMLLGMGLKSTTGSRKVVETVNHFGQCIGYHTAEEYETQIATTIIEKNRVLPDGLEASAGLSTNTAWDNYDESMYHDTQGICIQNEVPITSSAIATTTTSTTSSTSITSSSAVTTTTATSNSAPIIADATPLGNNKLTTTTTTTTMDTSSTSTNRRNKRSLEVSNPELEPVRKKPKISHFSFDVKTMDKPINYQTCVARDVAWTISCKTNKQTPMWSGWNSTITKDDLPAQKIGYLTNIGAPPTQHDVVNETLKRNVTIAKECKEDCIATTYDLAIAKPASQLQDTMRPKYDNIFVCFGAFHIQFRYLSAIGYLLDGSGAAHLLMESGVLGKGSLNAFLSGKHYNQTRRMHVLLATAMRIKHIDLFLKMEEANDSYGHLVETLKNVQTTPSPESMNDVEQTDEYKAFMVAYQQFCDDSRAGKYGVNAQFWRDYIDMVNIYMLFSRAVRTNDVDLFTFMLGEMIDIFFAANRHNYARYMCLYYLRLLNMDTTHPGIRQQLQRGGLSVRLSSNSFARQPVDQALESTINADAASRQTGIIAFHQSQGATRRWTVTRSARSTIVRHLFEKAAIRKDTDPSHELRKSNIGKFQRDLESISNMIETTMNPFAEPLLEDTNLYCLADGKKMPNEVKEDMLNIFHLGNKWKEEFLQQCFQDPARFEKPLHRRKVKNFASAATKSKVRGKHEKIVELKTTRDLLGRLVYLACTRKIELEKVFPFPLTPVPLSLASIHGMVKKTPKYKLSKHLEQLITHEEPAAVDVVLYDAMFIIQSLPSDLPLHFGNIAELVLRIICSTQAREVHFVCDSYVKSIKNIEQQARGASDGSFLITGADQLRPKDFRHALRSPSFKTALLKFFMEEWKDDKYAPVIQQKIVIVAHEEQCLQYTTSLSGTVEHNEAPQYICSHVEADTRLAYHLSVLSKAVPGQNVVVRATDADIMIILLYHSRQIEDNVWMDVGHSSDNTRRYVHITALANHLGPILCKALPGYHAMTGCDYTSTFFRKGKVNPLKIAEKSALHLEGLGNIGESTTFVDTDSLVEKYVCSLYGQRALSSVNEARVKIFHQKYKPTDQDSPLERIKGIDAGMLPPCKDVLTQKMRRCNYVAYLWKHAHLKDPLENIQPTDHGWKEVNGVFLPLWFTGSQMPTVLSETIGPEDITDVEEDDSDNDSISDSESEDEDDSDDGGADN